MQLFRSIFVSVKRSRVGNRLKKIHQFHRKRHQTIFRPVYSPLLVLKHEVLGLEWTPSGVPVPSVTSQRSNYQKYFFSTHFSGSREANRNIPVGKKNIFVKNVFLHNGASFKSGLLLICIFILHYTPIRTKKQRRAHNVHIGTTACIIFTTALQCVVVSSCQREGSICSLLQYCSTSTAL